MSTRFIVAVYDGSEAGRRVMANAEARLPEGERGTWRDLALPGSTFRVAFPRRPRWARMTWDAIVADVGSDVREGLIAAAAGAEPSTFAVLTYEETAMTRRLYGIAGREIERAIDARGKAHRPYVDASGRRRRTKGNVAVDPSDFERSGALDETRYFDALHAAEAPFCALAWFEETTGVGRSVLIDAAYRADDEGTAIAPAEDVAKPEAELPRELRALRTGLDARSYKTRIDALFERQSTKPSDALLEMLRGALADPHPRVRATAACVVHLLRPEKRALRAAGPLVEALFAALDDPSFGVAANAATAVADLEAHSETILARAKKALASTDPRERALGVTLLNRATDLPSDLAAPLLKVVESAWPKGEIADHRRFAVHALGAVRGTWKTILPVLQSLQDDPNFSDAALDAMGKLDAPASVKQARIVATPIDAKNATSLIDGLLDARASVEDLLPRIAPLAGSNEKARRAYVACLERIAQRRDDDRPIAMLEAMLDDRSARVQMEALTRLAWLDGKRPAALMALKRATTHASLAIRTQATTFVRARESAQLRGG